MRLKTDTFRGIATTYNVLAESKDGDPNNVVMVGAHLDSVNAGPGIKTTAPAAPPSLKWRSRCRRSSRATRCASPCGALRNRTWSARPTMSTT